MICASNTNWQQNPLQSRKESQMLGTWKKICSDYYDNSCNDDNASNDNDNDDNDSNDNDNDDNGNGGNDYNNNNDDDDDGNNDAANNICPPKIHASRVNDGDDYDIFQSRLKIGPEALHELSHFNISRPFAPRVPCHQLHLLEAIFSHLWGNPRF